MSAITAKVKFIDLDIQAHEPSRQIWREAESLPLTKYWSGIDAAEGRHAEARLLFNSEAFLVRFECKQSEPLIINDKLSLTQKTIGLWEKDVCEAFISPNPEIPEEYFEFEGAPTGEWVDLKIRQVPGKRETDWDYASGMTCFGEINSDNIVITLRIPWLAFGKQPEIGEKWRGNLMRCVGSGKDRGYLSWQPTFTPEPNFHVPQAFGWFEFVK
jgi:alpha-galactosidase